MVPREKSPHVPKSRLRGSDAEEAEASTDGTVPMASITSCHGKLGWRVGTIGRNGVTSLPTLSAILPTPTELSEHA